MTVALPVLLYIFILFLRLGEKNKVQLPEKAPDEALPEETDQP
jgi:hypothetical protein